MPAGALGGYLLRNRQLQNSTRQLLYIAGIAVLNLGLGASPDAMIDNSGHIGGLIAGAWLGYTAGPRFVVLRELDIPDGSIMVPSGLIPGHCSCHFVAGWSIYGVGGCQ